MISLQLAAGIFTVLVFGIGLIHIKMEQKAGSVRKLEKLLEDARRELSSLELLKSRFLGRIADILAEPLKAIESTSNKLSKDNPGLPDGVLSDLERLSGDVHSLVRMLNVFEQISRNETDAQGEEKVEIREILQLDEIVSEAAMDISEAASDAGVSLSVSICGAVQISGKGPQITEAVSSLLQETLRRSRAGTVMSIDLRVSRNIELEINWAGNDSPAANAEKKENLFGTGLTRLIASSHGGWVSEDQKGGRITLILPKAGELE